LSFACPALAGSKCAQKSKEAQSRVPKNKKSAIFVILRGSSKKDDPLAGGFCFFGNASLARSGSMGSLKAMR